VVFVVDDDTSLIETLRKLIVAAGWQVETHSCADTLLSCSRRAVPSCLILEQNLPDCSGLHLQRLLSSDREKMPVIFTSSHGCIETAVEAIKAGALEFFLKPLNEDDILAAIERALDRSRSALAHERVTQQLQSRYSLLSPREREVMYLVTRGLLNKQVAFHLGISEITVKAHRGQVMRKMRAFSLPALVEMAAQLNLSQ
jgi:FixJ family two-component response regulator